MEKIEIINVDTLLRTYCGPPSGYGSKIRIYDLDDAEERAKAIDEAIDDWLSIYEEFSRAFPTHQELPHLRENKHASGRGYFMNWFIVMGNK